MTNWQELSRESVFRGYGGRGVDRVTYLLPDGTQDDFDIKVEPDAAAVLALTINNTFLTVRQYRPGPRAILDELPGGMHDAGGSPFDTVTRELQQETGYAPGQLRAIARIPPDAYNTRHKWAYLATGCYPLGGQNLDPTEFGEVREWSPDAFLEHALSGQMTDTEVALLGLVHVGILGPPIGVGLPVVTSI